MKTIQAAAVLLLACFLHHPLPASAWGKNYYYHYTSKEGVKGIIQAGVITQSTERGHSRCGPGVYLTTLKPDASRKEAIARNNYGQWEQALRDHKVDCAFRLSIADAQVKDCPSGTRSVHVFKGDLSLKGTACKVVDLGTGDCLSLIDSPYPCSNQVMRRANSAIIFMCMLGLFVFL